MKKIWILAAVCVLSLVGMVLALRTPAPTGEFVPPPFEAAAETGTPADPGESWTRIWQEGMSFSAHVCGRVAVREGRADLFFTNDGENEVWMKLRILDEAGNILAETGLLRPGEYLRTVSFDQSPKTGAALKLKIMTYEPETYYSAGAVTLTTIAE